MPYKNKEDQAKAAAKHYQANKEKMKARAIEHRRKQSETIRNYIADLKSVLCTDCKGYQPGYNIHFDHVSDNKLFNIADKVYQSISLETMKAEIEKCEIVCAHCHGHRTYARRGGDTVKKYTKPQPPVRCDGPTGDDKDAHWLYSYTFKDAEVVWKTDHCTKCLTVMGVSY